MKKLILLSALFLTFTITNAQDCKPSKVSEQLNGDIVNLYGGKIRNGGFGSNDKSIYSVYIAQNEEGKKGTTLVAVLSEYVKSKREYNDAINNFLNENNLKTSTLEIRVNGKPLKFKATSCTQQPSKFLGDIKAYNVIFESDISKSQIEELQKFDLEKFRLVIGGHPYERYFKKPTKRTGKLKEAFSCIDMKNVFELEKKDATEMDLTEVEKSEYSNFIKGKWVLQGSNGKVLKFLDKNFIYSKKGVKLTEGSYKIVGNKMITTSSSGNGVSEIIMFLKDMLMLKEKSEENTYERIN
jgi:hypothetical protein